MFSDINKKSIESKEHKIKQENTKKLNLLFPYNSEIESEYIKKYEKINWKMLYYDNLGPNCKERFSILKKKLETQQFIIGLEYENGYNNEVNLKKSFDIYKNAADNTADYMSMYKMYLIYLCQYEKFNVERDKILSIFYLSKCITYLPTSIITFTKTLCQIDPIYDFIAILNKEDPDSKKFLKMIELLKKNDKYQINSKLLSFIKSIMTYIFSLGESSNINDILLLSVEGDLEATYKLAFIYISEKKDKIKILDLFKILHDKHYYRSYFEYGKYLFNELHSFEGALSILKEGAENGDVDCFSLYYRCYIYFIDFEALSSNRKLLEECVDNVIFLIDSIISGQTIFITEVLSFQNIFYKYYHIQDYFEKKYSKYIFEFVQFIIKVEKDKEYLKLFSSEKYGLLECISSLCSLYITGNIKLISKNKNEAERLLFYIMELDISCPKSYIFSLIFKIRRKDRKNNKNSEVTDKLFDETKSKLYHYYISRLSEQNLSQSFLYYMGVIYDKGIGTNQNLESAYLFFNQAAYYKDINIYSTVLSYFRQYKSKKILENNKYLKYKEIFNNDFYFLEQDENEKNSNNYINNTCNICWENVENVIIFPCKHKICNICIKKLEEQKCPFCRGIIYCSKTIKYRNNFNK